MRVPEIELPKVPLYLASSWNARSSYIFSQKLKFLEIYSKKSKKRFLFKINCTIIKYSSKWKRIWNENHENRCPPLFCLCYRHVRWYTFESSLQCCRECLGDILPLCKNGKKFWGLEKRKKSLYELTSVLVGYFKTPREK